MSLAPEILAPFPRPPARKAGGSVLRPSRRMTPRRCRRCHGIIDPRRFAPRWSRHLSAMNAGGIQIGPNGIVIGPQGIVITDADDTPCCCEETYDPVPCSLCPGGMIAGAITAQFGALCATALHPTSGTLALSGSLGAFTVPALPDEECDYQLLDYPFSGVTATHPGGTTWVAQHIDIGLSLIDEIFDMGILMHSSNPFALDFGIGISIEPYTTTGDDVTENCLDFEFSIVNDMICWNIDSPVGTTATLASPDDIIIQSIGE